VSGELHDPAALLPGQELRYPPHVKETEYGPPPLTFKLAVRHKCTAHLVRGKLTSIRRTGTINRIMSISALGAKLNGTAGRKRVFIVRSTVIPKQSTPM
jgi:hypothetical protein